jgi:predicted amino acid dehydrogenase
VAVVGATGAIAKSVATALRQKGQRYRVIGRSLESFKATSDDDPYAELARHADY